MDADRGPQADTGVITIEQEKSGRRVLRLRGNVDTAVATRFRSEHGRDRRVVDAIDAGEVTFISSSGLSLIVMFAEASAAAGRRPVLRSASRSMERVLALAGIGSLLLRSDSGTGAQPAGDSGPPTEEGARPS